MSNTKLFSDTPTRLALLTVGILVAFSFYLAQTADASSWNENPLERLSPANTINTSFELDYKKDLVPKSYSWATSKVCGLQLCIGENIADKSRSHMQGQYLAGSAPPILGPIYGMSSIGTDDRETLSFSTVIEPFSGFYIKGFFPIN